MIKIKDLIIINEISKYIKITINEIIIKVKILMNLLFMKYLITY
jgi:hypothetical protein